LLTRRRFLRRCSTGAALALGAGATARAPALGQGPPRITEAVTYRVIGRRLTPVAPNAYAPYRGYEVSEPLVRLRTNQGLEGIGWNHQDVAQELIGLNPLELFDWEGERISGPRPEYRELLYRLRGTDIALLDLIGNIQGKPVAELLGPQVRDRVLVYDSSLYQEDLLTQEQRMGLVYLTAPVKNPEEMVARKAEWVLRRGYHVMKIKTGRGKWIPDWNEALERDIAVVHAARQAVGPEPTLFVDANNGYAEHPDDILKFLKETRAASLYAVEEMYDEKISEPRRRLREALRGEGLDVKMADGEGNGLSAEHLESNLFDINQPDMVRLGFIRMMEAARASRTHGVRIAPHNFGTKMGLFAQAHLCRVIPNFAFAESDDAEFPAYAPEGIVLDRGHLMIEGLPGLGVRLVESELGEPNPLHS